MRLPATLATLAALAALALLAAIAMPADARQTRCTLSDDLTGGGALLGSFIIRARKSASAARSSSDPGEDPRPATIWTY